MKQIKKDRTMQKEIRTRVNQTAHFMAQFEYARIRMELITLCEQLQKDGKTFQEIMQAIDRQAKKYN